MDYSRYNTELNSMTINKLFPHYFAVAGMNDYIYLHDRRMMPSKYTEFGPNDPMNTLKCIKRFSPTLDGFSRPNKHITACKFSDSNGYELIGSWSSDEIYLFNINDPPVQSSRNTITTGKKRKIRGNDSDDSTSSTSDLMDIDTDNGTAINTTNSNENQRARSLWDKILRDFFENNLTDAISVIDELLSLIDSCHSSTINDVKTLKSCVYFVRASIMIQQLQECYLTQYTNDEINETIEKAESFAPSNWKGTWCKAIGYWILGGGTNDSDLDERGLYLRKSLEYAKLSKTNLEDEISARNSQPSSSTTFNTSVNNQLTDDDYRRIINAFIQDIELACVYGGYVENTYNVSFDENIESDEREEQYKWLRLIFINTVQSFRMLEGNSLPSFSETSPLPSNNEDRRIYTDSSSDSTSDRDESDENIAPMEEDEESLYTQIMSRQIMDIYRRGNDIDSDEDDSDFDLEAINILHENVNYPSFDTDVGVVKPRMRYSGHCNIETVKDVEFYGLRDEYIASGSDRGHVFIWDKKTGKIVQILHGDEDVVNVTKGHPFLPIMAVSGIDSTVKIFKPTSRLPTTLSSIEPTNPNSYSTSSRLYDQEEIVSTNRENNRSIGDDIYMTRSVYAAFLRMERQRRLLAINNTLGDEEADIDRTLTVLDSDYSSSSNSSSSESL